MRLFNSLGMTIATSSDRPERQRRIGGCSKFGLHYSDFTNPHPTMSSVVGDRRKTSIRPRFAQGDLWNRRGLPLAEADWRLSASKPRERTGTRSSRFSSQTHGRLFADAGRSATVMIVLTLGRGGPMAEIRKLAAVLCSDVVGYSRLAGADEDRILARLRALCSDLIDPTIAVHNGRVVKRTGDGSIVEFRSVVDAVRCALEVQNAMVERNAGVPDDRRIVFRIGIHLGGVVEESDGDLMGDGVNIAARLEGIAEPGAICLSEDAYRQVKGRLDVAVTDLGPTQLKNIAEPIRVYSLNVGARIPATPATAPAPEKSTPPRLSIVVLPFANLGGDPSHEHFV